MMRKVLCNFILISTISCSAWGTTRDAQLTNTTQYNYNYMYPYLNNQMRTNLNPGTTNSQSSNPINAVVRTIPLGAQRQVVPRQPRTVRVATTPSAPTQITNMRTAPTPTSNRRVVARRPGRGASIARSGTIQPQSTRLYGANRDQSSVAYRTTDTQIDTYTTPTARMSSPQCLAAYTDCMNKYCVREDTAYNRCYCSAKLSQIDAKYKDSINNLVNQIIMIQNTNRWSDAEMNEYWMSTIGKYTGDNSWENIDNALNIDWAAMESRVRGQNAFTTGHEYCVQYLRGCGYMASNLRDAYRSEISRDCATYEQSLQRIKNAAESIIEAYK